LWVLGLFVGKHNNYEFESHIAKLSRLPPPLYNRAEGISDEEQQKERTKDKEEINQKEELTF